YAQRLRRDEVSRGDADARPRHRSVGEPHGQHRLDLDRDHAGRLLDTLERILVGDTQAAHILDPYLPLAQPLLDLGAAAMDQDQADAQAVQQGDVMREAGETLFGNDLSTED